MAEVMNSIMNKKVKLENSKTGKLNLCSVALLTPSCLFGQSLITKVYYFVLSLRLFLEAPRWPGMNHAG